MEVLDIFKDRKNRIIGLLLSSDCANGVGMVRLYFLFTNFQVSAQFNLLF